jgi:hypothetical protein
MLPSTDTVQRWGAPHDSVLDLEASVITYLEDPNILNQVKQTIRELPN